MIARSADVLNAIPKEKTVKVLMVGATGLYASLVVPELTKRGVTIRALVQDESKGEQARKQGAQEIAVGSLRSPASLRPAAEGVDGVFHINPAFAPDEADMGMAMVDAAKAAGVRKFVFSSVIHPSISKMINHAAKRPVEEALYESGMDFTVLQPTMFMQTLDGAWGAVNATGQFALPFAKTAKVSYIDYRDVAEAAALAFTGDTLSYGTFELCASGMVDRMQIAALMSEALERTITAGEIAFDEWAQKAHLPDGPIREGMKRMDADYDRYGFPGGNALVLRAILGREPRTLKQYIQEMAERPKAAA